MSLKLSDEDRQAVDLLLDTSRSSGNGVMKVTASVSQKRLAAAEKVLNLLGAMPADEPPADLLARTIERIEAATTHRGVRHSRRSHVQAPPVS